MAQGTSGKKITIVGAGHMGTALAKGLVRGGVPKSSVVLIDKGDVVSPVGAASIVFLAVKPSVVPEALRGIRHLLKGKLVVSLAAGVGVATLKKYAGTGVRIARIMPNIPVAVNEGVVGLFAPGFSTRERAELITLLSRLGLCIEVKKENALDALTLISGCGPGVVAYLVDALAKNASRFGLKGFQAEQVAFQTFKGTLSYMQANLISAVRMQESVATKGGVTEAILSSFRTRGLQKDFERAMEAGKKKLRHV